MSFRFKDIDRGAAAMVRQIGSIGTVAVDVGVIGERAVRSDEDGKATVGDVATWAEFGIGQPERSWCRGWVDENEKKAQALAHVAAERVAHGMPVDKAAEAMGLKIAAGMQERIANRIEPPNAPSTIAHKGSSTPLVNNGQFRSSIAPRVVR